MLRLLAALRKLRVAAAVGVAMGAVTATVAAWRPPLVERGEHWTYDPRARSGADPGRADRNIVMLDISEQDIEDAENNFDVTWPWPRALYGYLAAYAARAGARAIVFDWLFQDRGQYSVSDAEEFAAAMRASGRAVIGLALSRRPMVARAAEGPFAAAIGTYPARQEAEAAAIRLMAWNVRCYLVGDGPVTLHIGGKRDPDAVRATWRRVAAAEELTDLFAAATTAGEPTVARLPPAHLAREFTAADIVARRDALNLPVDARFPDLAGIDPPLAVIAAAPARTGNVYQDTEADGIIRRHTPLAAHGGRLYPSLALAALLVARPGTRVALEGGDLVLDGRHFPLDAQGKQPIRFHGADVYPHHSAYQILQSQALLDEGKPPSVPLAALRDRIIIVSATGQALRDVRSSPVAQVHQGAAITAAALDNLLHGNAIRRVSRAADAGLALALSVLAALLVVVLWQVLSSTSLALVVTAGATTLLLLGYWWMSVWLYQRHGLWIAVATPTAGAVATAFIALLSTSAAERRGRRFVQEALGRYTSPALVRELTEHPEYLSLEWGQRREMSVYFSDIAGFTTISEGLAPERLVALLNDYLTHMTDIVLAHGGVVDKYIGDAIMAFWGAPLPDEQHASRAVRCALAMRKRCLELQPTWQATFGALVTARAGINSGIAVVGNMGSKHKYNYTVMGDMVNLASRLEGANKPYGTYLMISEDTYRRVAFEVDVRELDLLAVKGKEQPVRVYEVLDLAGQTEAGLARVAEIYRAGLELYQARAFPAASAQFEQALRLRPDDGPSLTYLERCRHFGDNPPAADWDGVWRLHDK